MNRARVTSKGQVTVPVAIRQHLDLEQGDDLIFEIKPEGVRLRALKRRPLSALFGALPATRPYPGVETIRQEIGQALEGHGAGDPR
jgi:AbrB family looped-hinge helix DNA binding protein